MERIKNTSDTVKYGLVGLFVVLGGVILNLVMRYTYMTVIIITLMKNLVWLFSGGKNGKEVLQCNAILTILYLGGCIAYLPVPFLYSLYNLCSKVIALTVLFNEEYREKLCKMAHDNNHGVNMYLVRVNNAFDNMRKYTVLFFHNLSTNPRSFGNDLIKCRDIDTLGKIILDTKNETIKIDDSDGDTLDESY